jgi:antitoxin component YwqK of YwqJK toxin-antitoxin module
MNIKKTKVTFSLNNDLRTYSIYINDDLKTKIIEYYSDGKLITKRYYNNIGFKYKEEGSTYKNGNKLYEIFYPSVTQSFIKIFLNSGLIKEIFLMKDNVAEGEYIEFVYRNGKRKEK